MPFRHPSGLVLVAILACTVPAQGTSVRIGADCSDRDLHEAWEKVLAAVTVLERGSREERLALFRHAGADVEGPFYAPWLPDECEYGATTQMVGRLVNWAADVHDVWLLNLVAANVAQKKHRAALPFFRVLSHSPSPSLRLRAIEYLEDRKDDRKARAILIAMWQVETEAWVRARLLDAIVSLTPDTVNRSEPPFNRCLGLIDHDDPDLAIAAMRCAALYRLPGAEDRLLNVLEQHPDVGRRAHAVNHLSTLTDLTTASANRIASLFASEPVGYLRSLMFELLVDRSYPRARSNDGSPVRARRLVRDALEHIAPSISLDDGERDRNAGVIRCFPPSVLDPMSYRLQRIAHPSAGRSQRCYAGPGVEAAAGKLRRLTAGDSFLVLHRFDDGESTWWYGRPFRTPGCWIPASSAEAWPPDAGWEIDRDGLPDPEFDLPLDILNDPVFSALEMAGLVTLFDQGRTVTGARLNISEAGLEGLETLLLPATLTDSLLEPLEPWVERIEQRIGELKAQSLGPQRSEGQPAR